jgi:N-dimethylarginine dimethylaminohydrolase
MRMFVEEPVHVYMGDDFVRVFFKDNPALFMHNLAHEYHSSQASSATLPVDLDEEEKNQVEVDAMWDEPDEDDNISAAMSIVDDDAPPEIVSGPEILVAGAAPPLEATARESPSGREDRDRDSFKVRVNCDYDRLRAVVVGRGDNDVIPEWYPTFNPDESNEVDDPNATGKTKAEYDPEAAQCSIDQQNELCKLLESEGVEVMRPPLISVEDAKANPVGLSQSWMREVFTVIGNKLIINQPRTPHRNKDHHALEPLFAEIERAGLATIHRLPPCSFDRNEDWEDDLRPFLEGGDIFRFGKSVIVTMSYLASSPTGYRWLADLLAPDGIEVWPAYLAQEWEHGDYVFMPVREGLCIAYLQGFKDGMLPAPVMDWNCIPLTYEEADEGFAANGIVLRENVVLMPKGNRRVVRALEKKGVDVIEVEFEGPQFWEGAIDCSTSELWRE